MDRLNKLLALATGVAGMVVYVYVLGGLVVWARLTASRLYTDSAVDALGSKSLLATGLEVVVFEIGVLALLSGLAWFLWRRFSVTRESSSESRKGPIRVGWLIVQGLLVAFVVACLLAILSLPPLLSLVPAAAWVGAGLTFEESDFFQIARNRWLSWGLGLAVAICAVLFSAAAPGISALILFALVRNNVWFEECLSSEKSSRLIAPILTLSVALSVIVLAFLTTPPVTFDRVVVVEKDGSTVEGGYVARSGDGVFVATCKQFRDDPHRSKKPRLQVIPNDSVKQLTFGGDRYAIDNGKRPSLLDLGLRLFSQDPIEEHLPGWRPSVRGKLEVCDTRMH
ncbi:MAG TPA: hypothetical protein VH042_04280 [Solirubrobacterales bacterium]|jgi:hypothetical protein|nr:hypothetical protein [Solirubrobacterales bacterium]